MNEQIRHYEDKLRFEIDAWDLNEALQGGRQVTVLDARGPEAYAREHIRGAVHFPHRTMTPDNTAALDRRALYVVYCDGIGCNASSAGALNMAKLGFEVKELIGGLEWWKRSGFATEGAVQNPASPNAECGCA